jgi:outer membrane protein assembly factor BamA
MKFKPQISVLTLIFFSINLAAQQYRLYIKGVDKDSATIVKQAGIQTLFNNKTAASQYLSKLPSFLQSKGYITASIDTVAYDSTHARIVLYAGPVYKWARLDAGNVEQPLLDGIGWREKSFNGKVSDFNEVSSWQLKMLDYLENTGYPFARVYLDSISISTNPSDSSQIVNALLKVNKGPLYKIDSIRLYGNAKISSNFLQRYFELPNGSVYSKEKLIRINKKIRELNYVEEEKPADLSMLGTGSVLNLYLRQKKSSQFNVIIGFLPNNNQLASKKLLVTGEGNLLLRNSLGGGETFGLDFQAVQVSSQRLNILFRYPYIFHSAFGIDFIADLFRKDSSFVNLNARLGASYELNSNESGRLFLQTSSTIVNEGAINSALIIQTKKLPDVADVSSVNAGLDYEYNRTDYRLNPRKGTEISIITSIGTKKVKKNNTVLGLKDPSSPGFDFKTLYDTVKLKTYQLRVMLEAAKYFPVGKTRTTIKTAMHAGTFQSGNIFRNELFQIGGYRLLRGFDEQSQYLSSYAIGTVEYRYLVGQNSFFYVLADGGWGQDNRQRKKIDYTYFGTGLGIAFETKAGIINLAWAIGSRNDIPFNLRQSKIHFGFVNYF